MFTAPMFADVTTALTDELAIIIPAGIAVFAVLFGIRKGLSVFRSLAR